MRREKFGQALSIDRYRCSQPVTANHAPILLLDVFDCFEMTEFAFTRNEKSLKGEIGHRCTRIYTDLNFVFLIRENPRLSAANSSISVANQFLNRVPK